MKRLFLGARKKAKNEEGATIILVVFMLIVLLGCAALALDFGRVYLQKSRLQNAVDVSARAASIILAGKEENPPEGETDEEKELRIREVIKSYLSQNGFDSSNLSTCDIEVDVTTGISIDAVSNVDLNFGRIFTKKPIAVTASTTAITDVYTTAGRKVTVDVVFVLDVSTSMFKYTSSTGGAYTERFVPMMNAVNQCIDLILQENPDNRIGICVYGGRDASTIMLNLTKNPTPVSGEFTYSGNTYEYCECPTGPTYIGYYGSGSKDVVKDYLLLGTQDKVFKANASGTYTQYGMVMATEMLENAEHDGIERYPAIFVLSDGEATWGNKYWDTYPGDEFLNAVGYPYATYANSGASEYYPKVGFYTILTANKCKQKVTDVYTARNGKSTTCSFYTLGFKMEKTSFSDYSRSVLNPGLLLEDSSLDSKAAEMLRYLDGTDVSLGTNPYYPNYNYCDKYYDASTETELSELLVEFANDVVVPTKNFTTRLTR